MNAQNKRIDVDALKLALPIEDLIAGYDVDLKQHGDELRACCPFHSENTPSFTVTPENGTYYCFGCDAGGDHISFLRAWHNEDFPDAARRLATLSGSSPENVPPAAQRRTAPERKASTTEWIKGTSPGVVPAPTELRVKEAGQWVAHPVVAAWPYFDRAGELHGYACRIHRGVDENGKPKKDVIPVSWQTNTETGESRWKQGAFADPRPLYGADLLDAAPDAAIIIAEGEKDSDAGRRLLAGVVPHLVMTWPGGSKAINKADWELLRGRMVVGWPDCDSKRHERGDQKGEYLPYVEQPGMAAMLRIADLADRYGFRMRIVEVPAPGSDWEDGWGFADAETEGWTGKQIMEYARANMRTAAEIRQRHPVDQPPQDMPAAANDNKPRDAEPIMPARTDFGEPFRILGWNKGSAYYMPFDSQQVVALAAGSHTKLNLMQLAPLSFWTQIFRDETSTKLKVDWDMAADSLMTRAKRMKPFNREMIRGRGVWREDDGRVTVHLGDKVVIDGQVYAPSEAPSDYVYESSHAMRMAIGDPLSDAEAQRLMTICESIRWEKKIYGVMLAGWVFLAPICGALGWRPSIWVTGGKGSGKTTVMRDVVQRCVRRSGHFLVGDSSEAGIRHTLGSDAMPIMFDEFESERQKAKARTEDVLALVTASSSESDAKLAKGGTGGQADVYRIRSMFAFSSISVNIQQSAAISRVSVLSLRTPTAGDQTEADNQQYEELQRAIATLTPDYVDRLQARAVSLIPEIQHNAEIFTRAAAIVLGSRRSGEQIGTLLAGAYALHRQGQVSLERAREWLESRDWTDEREDIEDSDENMCLQHILAWQVRVSAGERGVPMDRSIGELVGKLAGRASDYMITAEEARRSLGHVGIVVDNEHMVIANRHRALEKILDGKPWQPPAHARVLLRIKGARKTGTGGSTSTYRFGGITSRGVAIPITEAGL